MNASTLETRLQALENQVAGLKKDVAERDRQLRELRDIGDIKKLQCAYGYYLEHWMADEIIDCFSKRPDVAATFVEGTYFGPESIRRYFHPDHAQPPTFLHLVMQVSPVITLDPDGVRAKGRWYGYGNILARYTRPLDPMYMAVTYEMDYIKEDGVWKILVLRLLMHFAYAYGLGKAPEGQVETPRRPPEHRPDEWSPHDTEYPSGYIYPMHFVHPVTGRPTSENERNAKLALGPNRFRPAQA
jgi:hypothetical protein